MNATDKNPRSFVEAGREKPVGLMGELFLFMKNNKKFWLAPIVIVLLAMSVLVFLGGTAAAPFIYTLF
jgi:hypothetical protein